MHVLPGPEEYQKFVDKEEYQQYEDCNIDEKTEGSATCRVDKKVIYLVRNNNNEEIPFIFEKLAWLEDPNIRLPDIEPETRTIKGETCVLLDPQGKQRGYIGDESRLIGELAIYDLEGNAI